MDYVLIHVHDGMVHAWRFDTFDEVEDFREKYDDAVAHSPETLPGTTIKDRRDKDTWVLVEAMKVVYVDGDEVKKGKAA
jgi:hypothetical protein